MSTEKRLQWLTALRSGSYKQGKHYLHNGDNFCCLGVLCHLNKDRFDVTQTGTVTRYDGCYQLLPSVLREELGLDIETLDELVSMNDGGKSFTEIANYLEKYFEDN